jgi:hypothetical protein
MKIHMRCIPIRCFILVAVLLLYAAESSGQYQLRISVLGSGGGTISGGGYTMLSTAGQPFIGRSQSAELNLFAGVWHQYNIATSVEPIEDQVPREYRLEQNYPNPFNPSTTIRFSIPERQNVRLSVYDLLGREVAKLIDEEMNAGWYSVVYHAAGLSSGVYVYRIHTESFVSTKRFILLK